VEYISTHGGAALYMQFLKDQANIQKMADDFGWNDKQRNDLIAEYMNIAIRSYGSDDTGYHVI
jgi:hypothetical protein